MGTLTHGETFGVNEEVTNEKLHDLVDDATITDIRNNDIASGAGIEESKISFAGTTVVTLSDNQTISGDKTYSGDVTFQGIVDLTNATITTLMEKMYPVGSVVTLGVSTNPGTLYGVGTWTAIAGKVIVGIAGSGTFDTINAEGGAETVTLTSAQSGLPAHTHPFKSNRTSGGGTANLAYAATTDSASTTDNTMASSVSANSTADAAEAHPNLQPYIVKYVWERTE